MKIVYQSNGQEIFIDLHDSKSAKGKHKESVNRLIV